MSSCTSQFPEVLVEQNNETHTLQVSGVQKDIMANIMATRFGGYNISNPDTRAMEEFTMTPYVLEGDTVMYIVQYKDGWEIYSAKKCAEMIQFKMAQGQFNLNDPAMPPALRFLIESRANEIKVISESGKVPEDPSWGPSPLILENPEDSNIHIDYDLLNQVNGYSVSPLAGPWHPEPEGGWVLIREEVMSEGTTVSEKLIKTLWSQWEPWNSYTPIKQASDGTYKNCPLGCAAVALGQYLYYTHFKDNVPECTVDHITWNYSKHEYEFSGNSNIVWDNMAKTPNEESTDAVAIFLAYLGKQLGTSYEVKSSSTKESKILEVLKYYFGNVFSKETFAGNQITNSIMKKYPVICTANPANSDNGHLFLVDQYEREYKRTRYYYGWEGPYGPDGVDTNLRDPEGNIIGWAITMENDVTLENYRFSMNWGHGDRHYNSLLYTENQNWFDGGYEYTNKKRMYVRSDI